GARIVRDKLPAGSLDAKILTWAIATSGDGAVRSGEIAAAAHTLEGWPGAAALRDHSERALHRENPAPRLVLDAFGASQPQTAQGAVVLARAHLATGKAETATKVL